MNAVLMDRCIDVLHSCVEGEGAHEPLRLTKELQTVDGFWGRQGQFSLKVWLLVGQPPSNGWPLDQEYYGKFKLESLEGREVVLRGVKGTSLR